LECELQKEKSDRKAEVEALKNELQKERRDRKDDLEALRQVLRNSRHYLLPLTIRNQVTCLLTPLHLRVLLDLTRQKILHALSYDTWEDLRNNRNMHELAHYIIHRLAHVSDCPSHEAIFFLCSYNNVRRDGNTAAHEADQEDVRAAVLRKPIDSKDRRCLEEMYMYTYSSEL
jgi:hypothetical protein